MRSHMLRSFGALQQRYSCSPPLSRPRARRTSRLSASRRRSGHCPCRCRCSPIWSVPVGDGPFPLVIMNHGVSLNASDRSFFPLVEFRDAAKWFARRGYLVVAPVGTGYGAAAIDIPERGIYGPFFSKVGKCTNPNFRDPGLAVATGRSLDHRLHGSREAHRAEGRHRGRPVRRRLGVDRPVEREPTAGEGHHHLCGGPRRAGRRQAEQQLRARQAGRGDRGFRPHLAGADAVDLHRERHVFRPRLSKRMHEAFTAAGGRAEYHLMPPFGDEGHFFIGSPDAIPIWSPLVAKFLDAQK